MDRCLYRKVHTLAKRCIDAFHVVTWTVDTLDELRKEAGEMLSQAVKTKLKRPSVRKVNLKSLILLLTS